MGSCQSFPRPPDFLKLRGKVVFCDLWLFKELKHCTSVWKNLSLQFGSTVLKWDQGNSEWGQRIRKPFMDLASFESLGQLGENLMRWLPRVSLQLSGQLRGRNSKEEKPTTDDSKSYNTKPFPREKKMCADKIYRRLWKPTVWRNLSVYCRIFFQSPV